MRSSIVRLLPLYAEHFHLSPSDVWALTVEEMNAFTDRLRQMGVETDAG